METAHGELAGKGNQPPAPLDRDCAGPTGADIRAKGAVERVPTCATRCEGPRNLEGATCFHLGFLQVAGPLGREWKGAGGFWEETLGGHHPVTCVALPEEGIGMEGRQAARMKVTPRCRQGHKAVSPTQAGQDQR